MPKASLQRNPHQNTPSAQQKPKKTKRAGSCLQQRNMLLILIASVLQPDRSYTGHANMQQDILYMLHGVLVFAPVVEVEASISFSLCPHFILAPFLMVQSTLCNIF